MDFKANGQSVVFGGKNIVGMWEKLGGTKTVHTAPCTHRPWENKVAVRALLSSKLSHFFIFEWVSKMTDCFCYSVGLGKKRPFALHVPAAGLSELKPSLRCHSLLIPTGVLCPGWKQFAFKICLLNRDDRLSAVFWCCNTAQSSFLHLQCCCSIMSRCSVGERCEMFCLLFETKDPPHPCFLTETWPPPQSCILGLFVSNQRCCEGAYPTYMLLETDEEGVSTRTLSKALQQTINPYMLQSCLLYIYPNCYTRPAPDGPTGDHLFVQLLPKLHIQGENPECSYF